MISFALFSETSFNTRSIALLAASFLKASRMHTQVKSEANDFVSQKKLSILQKTYRKESSLNHPSFLKHEHVCLML